MMKWYSVKDIIAGYAITREQLLAMCRNGAIGAMKMPDNRFKKRSWQYFIPEGELVKLSKYKTGNPLFKAEHQPSEYLTPQNLSFEAETLENLTGNYQKYLQSEHWRQIQKQAFLRDGYTCRLCGTGKNLRVHHVHYENLGSDKELDDVITLCDDCHNKVHLKDNEKGETL